MAEVQINQLLDEAAGHCDLLSDKATETQGAVDDMVEKAEALSKRIEAELEDAQTALKGLEDKLNEAEDALEAATEGAKSGLEAVVTKAGEVEADVGELLTRVKSELDELEAKNTELEGQLAAQGDDVGEAFEGLAEQIGKLQETIGKEVEEATAAVQAFRDRLAEARDDWDAKKVEFITALDDLDEANHEQTALYADAVAKVLESQTDVLENLANEKLIASHNDAIEKMDDALVQETLDQVGATVASLQGAMEALATTCGEHESAVEGKSGQILEKIAEAVSLVERIRPILELASRLG